MKGSFGKRFYSWAATMQWGYTQTLRVDWWMLLLTGFFIGLRASLTPLQFRMVSTRSCNWRERLCFCFHARDFSRMSSWYSQWCNFYYAWPVRACNELELETVSRKDARLRVRKCLAIQYQSNSSGFGWITQGKTGCNTYMLECLFICWSISSMLNHSLFL